LSKSIEALMRRMIAAGPPAKRPPHIGLLGFVGWLASFATVAVALLVALLIVSTGAAAAAEGSTLGEFIPATPPQPAPQVGFTDIDGKPASLADFKDMPAVVNLWATWCQPCLKEMPSLDRLQSRFAGRLIVTAVSEDRAKPGRVGEFVAAMGLRKLKIYLDPKGEVAHAFHVPGLPTTIIIDAGGQVVGRVEGSAEWDGPKMRAVLEPFLKSVPSPLKAAAR
jgi:thiol-disulfide isomerase/thioredoxin